MVILDVFEHNGKTAVYCSNDINIKKVTSKKAQIGDKNYMILTADVLNSLSGSTAITLLLDTKEKLLVRQEITLL